MDPIHIKTFFALLSEKNVDVCGGHSPKLLKSVGFVTEFDIILVASLEKRFLNFASLYPAWGLTTMQPP